MPYPWMAARRSATPDREILPQTPARPAGQHGADCYRHHPECAADRIDRARADAEKRLDAAWTTASARRAAEVTLAILTGLDTTPASPYREGDAI